MERAIFSPTTLAMLLAAQARGWSLHYLEQADLRLRDGVAEGRVRALTVRADPKDWYTLGEPAVAALGALDVILMRKDPPFDTEYIYTSYILERAELAGALVVNRARGCATSTRRSTPPGFRNAARRRS